MMRNIKRWLVFMSMYISLAAASAAVMASEADSEQDTVSVPAAYSAQISVSSEGSSLLITIQDAVPEVDRLLIRLPGGGEQILQASDGGTRFSMTVSADLQGQAVSYIPGTAGEAGILWYESLSGSFAIPQIGSGSDENEDPGYDEDGMEAEAEDPSENQKDTSEGTGSEAETDTDTENTAGRDGAESASGTEGTEDSTGTSGAETAADTADSTGISDTENTADTGDAAESTGTSDTGDTVNTGDTADSADISDTENAADTGSSTDTKGSKSTRGTSGTKTAGSTSGKSKSSETESTSSGKSRPSGTGSSGKSTKGKRSRTSSGSETEKNGNTESEAVAVTEAKSALGAYLLKLDKTLMYDEDEAPEIEGMTYEATWEPEEDGIRIYLYEEGGAVLEISPQTGRSTDASSEGEFSTDESLRFLMIQEGTDDSSTAELWTQILELAGRAEL